MDSLKGLKSCLCPSLPGNSVTVTCNVSVYPGDKASLIVCKKQKLTFRRHRKLKYIRLEIVVSGHYNTCRGFKRNPRELLETNPVRRLARSCISSCPSRQLLTELRGAATIPVPSHLKKCAWEVSLYSIMTNKIASSMHLVNLGSQSSSFSVS